MAITATTITATTITATGGSGSDEAAPKDTGDNGEDDLELG